MDAFFCIVISFFVLRAWWRHQVDEETPELKQPTINTFSKQPQKSDKQIEIDKARDEAERRRQRDINDLKRQGYTDELIATILPIINDGK